MGFFDRFKNKKEKTKNEEDIFSDFLKNYPPEENLIKPSEHIIGLQEVQKYLKKSLIFGLFTALEIMEMEL